MDLLFDRKLLQQNHKRYIDNFHNYNFLHHEISLRMIDCLNLFCDKNDFNRALEISSNDKFLKDFIVKEKNIKEFFQTSLSKLPENSEQIILDDEKLAFKNDLFDLIFHNLNLHFINSVPEFLLQIKNILCDKGIFIASFFGEQNLFSLKKAVFEAENKVYDGFSPRFIPTIDVKNAARLLQNAGFKNPVSSLEIIEVEYKNTLKLLHDLKYMMQGNIMLKRSKKFIHQKFIDEILKNYAKMFDSNNENKVKAQFEIIIMIAQK